MIVSENFRNRAGKHIIILGTPRTSSVQNYIFKVSRNNFRNTNSFLFSILL